MKAADGHQGHGAGGRGQKRDPGIAQVAETSSAPPRPTATEDAGTPGREAGRQAAGFYLMKVVFPVEYCPTRSTIGLLSKSASSRAGEWNSWNL